MQESKRKFSFSVDYNQILFSTLPDSRVAKLGFVRLRKTFGACTILAFVFVLFTSFFRPFYVFFT